MLHSMQFNYVIEKFEKHFNFATKIIFEEEKQFENTKNITGKFSYITGDKIEVVCQLTATQQESINLLNIDPEIKIKSAIANDILHELYNCIVIVQIDNKQYKLSDVTDDNWKTIINSIIEYEKYHQTYDAEDVITKFTIAVDNCCQTTYIRTFKNCSDNEKYYSIRYGISKCLNDLFEKLQHATYYPVVEDIPLH